MKEMKMGTFTYNNESYNFNFSTSLSAYDKMIFVQTVVDNVIDGNSYDIVIKDLIFDFVIIEMFTNIDTSFINIKDDNGYDISPIITIEHFLAETNIVDIIKENMEFGLLDELNHAVNLNIYYLTGINPNPLNESIAKLISTIEQKINEVDLNNMMQMAQKFANMTEDFTIDNIIESYMNSDIHKKNLMEIEEVKNKE